MSALSGIYSELPGLENLTGESIQARLKFIVEPHLLENFLANRILYPETIALTQQEKLIDWAIFEEYISRNPGYFYNPLSHKLVIPEDLFLRIQPTRDLIMTFCNLIQFAGVLPIFISNKTQLKAEGSLIVAENITGKKKETVTLDQKIYEVNTGELTNFPLTEQRIKLKIDNQPEIMINGGKLGISVLVGKKST